MAERPALTSDGNHRPTPGSRLWVRGNEPRWSFARKGVFPILGLVGVFAYALTAFAQKTEDQVRLTVANELRDAGLHWAKVDARGQTVELSGAAPSRDAEKTAVQVASRARCASWLGPLPCVQRVTAQFDTSKNLPAGPLPPSGVAPAKPEREPASGTAGSLASGPSASPAEATPSLASAADTSTPADTAPSASSASGVELKLKRKGETLEWTGAIPDEAAAALEQHLRTHFPSGQLKKSVSALPGTLSPGWEPHVEYAAELAARCEDGVVALKQGILDIECETQTASAKEALSGLLTKLPEGLTAGSVNVLAVDEIKSCEAALVKLVTRSQIRFSTNSAKLLPTSRPLLREIAHQLDRCPGVVVVEGHTDAQGDREANVTLSLNRARAVVAGLVGYGVPAARVRAEGFGPDRPLATNDTATGRAQNRRIEFRVARKGIGGE